VRPVFAIGIVRTEIKRQSSFIPEVRAVARQRGVTLRTHVMAADTTLYVISEEKRGGAADKQPRWITCREQRERYVGVIDNLPRQSARRGNHHLFVRPTQGSSRAAAGERKGSRQIREGAKEGGCEESGERRMSGRECSIRILIAPPIYNYLAVTCTKRAPGPDRKT